MCTDWTKPVWLRRGRVALILFLEGGTKEVIWTRIFTFCPYSSHVSTIINFSQQLLFKRTDSEGKTNKKPKPETFQKALLFFLGCLFLLGLRGKDPNLLTMLIKASQDCSIRQVCEFPHFPWSPAPCSWGLLRADPRTPCESPSPTADHF